MSIVRANGSAGSANCTLRVRPQGEVFTSKNFYNLSTGGGIVDKFIKAEKLESLTDIKLTCDRASDNSTTITGNMIITLIDNT
jgi:hypothetical protein